MAWENVGAELLGGEVPDGEPEARVVLQRHKESPQSSAFLQRPLTWV